MVTKVRKFLPAPASIAGVATLSRMAKDIGLSPKWGQRAYVLLCAERGRSCHFCLTGPLYGSRFLMASKDYDQFNNLADVVVCCPSCRKEWENQPYDVFVQAKLSAANGLVEHLTGLCAPHNE
jgi:hypothetical protein